MSKPEITVHKLRKNQDILRKVNFFPLFSVLDLVFSGRPIIGWSMCYSLRVGKVMFVLRPSLYTLYMTKKAWFQYKHAITTRNYCITTTHQKWDGH